MPRPGLRLRTALLTPPLSLLLAAPQAAAAPATAASSGHPRAATDLPYDVRDYDVDIAYTPESETLSGRTTLTATAGPELHSIELALRLTATSVTVDGAPVESFRQTDDTLRVDLPGPLPDGHRFTAEITYEGVPGESPAWVPTTDGGSVTVTGASVGTWFPAHDTTRDQALLRVRATVPSDWVAVSNGTATPPEARGDTAVFGWSTSHALSPESAVLGMGPWETERSRLSDGTPVTNVYGAGQKERMKPLADQAPRMVDFLAGAYGPYPFDTFGGIYVEALSEETPFYAPQGRVVFPAPDWADESVLVHELAHQWFGVSVGGDGSASACLGECFATYAEWMWAADQSGVDLDDRYRDGIREHQDDEAWWSGTIESGAATYTKSPFMMHALLHYVGEDAFRRLLTRWPTENAHGVRTWHEFEVMAGEEAGRDMTGFFDAWIRGRSEPPSSYLWPGTLTPRSR
ncbi:Peptidase family M1 [Streptomyces zhaozhouensis]|uniref:Peptidase family M1 n=1 Tax=Streptomyces zhaozhouensis TaxID=1300267 RepID=A0A286DVP3_9ACTN|nr:M1 family aminopeptidase [Streptomyces zhaozhouensis]SOD62680.1 Peptidase family M1 [Streptomyces zhaozhouensis]